MRSFLLICLFALVSMTVFSRIGFELGISAFADTPTDAGAAADAPSSSSGSGSATSAQAPTPPAAAAPNLTQDPAGFLAFLKSMLKFGWGAAVLVGVLGLCEALAALKNVSTFAWLGKGRVSVVIGAAAAVATTMIAALVAGGAWPAVAIAGGGALLLYWHPAGTDPAKS